ncbi:unnamed protein product [Scytosiphon promiscuus]
MGSMETRVSLSDVKLMSSMARSMHSAVQLARAATPIKALRHAHRQNMLAFARARRYRNPLTMEGFAFVGNDPEQAVEITGPHADPPVQVSMLQAGAGLPDVRLGLVSNALGMPLFHVDVRQLQAALRHEAGRYLDATVSATFGAGYFNQALYRREPVVEEVPLAVAVHRDEAGPTAGGGRTGAAGRAGDVDGDSDEGGAGSGGGGGRGGKKHGVMEAQLSLPEVVDLNVTHAMVSAVRRKALALSKDRVTTGSRIRQPFRMRNRCGEALALTVRRSTSARAEVRFTLQDGAEDTVDFGSFLAEPAVATVAASRSGELSQPTTPLRSRSRATTGSPSVMSGVARTSSVGGHTPLSPGARRAPAPAPAQQSPHWEPVASSGMSEMRHSLVVAMRHRGWLYVSSHACPVDAAGAHTMRMKRRMDGNLPKPKLSFGVGGTDRRDAPPAAVLFLVAEITVHDDGARILTLRTRVSIENACGVPVRLSLGRPGGTRLERDLESGAVAHVPLSLLEPDLEVHARPTASAGTSSDWATIIKSLSGAEKMARAAPRDKSNTMAAAATSSAPGARGDGGGSGGGSGGTFKVFAASDVPAPGAARGVRRFAGEADASAGNGLENGSVVAPTGWWVLADISANHDAPVLSGTGGNDESASEFNATMMAEALRRSSGSGSFSSRLRHSSSMSLSGHGLQPASSVVSPHHSRAGSTGGVSDAAGLDVSGVSGVDEEASSDGGEEGQGGARVPSPVFEKSEMQPWHPLGAPTRESLSAPATPPPRRRRRRGSSIPGPSSGGVGGIEAARIKGVDALRLASRSHSPVRRTGARGSATGAAAQSFGGWSDAGLFGGDSGTDSPSAATVSVPGSSLARSFTLKREIRGTKLENVLKEIKAAASDGPKPPVSTPVGTASRPASVETPPAVSLCLRAPLVLHNLLCSPMLYRVVNRQGLLAAEGVLPIGASVPLHRVDLRQKQYASFRLVNYPWSDFIKVHSPTSAHPLREKVRVVEVRGLKVSKGRELPNLHVHVALQGRDLSVFCRLWLVNRTEMVLQHRDSSLAGGIDSTFMGDRMPQITQPGRQEVTGTEGGDRSFPKPRMSPVNEGTRALTEAGAGAKGAMTPPRSLARAASDAFAHGIGNSSKGGTTPSPTRVHASSIRRGPAPGGVGFAGRGGSTGTGGEGGRSPPRSARGARGPLPGGVGFHGGSGGVRIALTVALPFCHLDEVDVEARASETAEGLISTVALEAGLGMIDPEDYFLCPLQAPTEDDSLAFSEIMTWEMDKRSLVDGQLRALKQSFGVSSGGSRASADYARWDRLGFVLDDYRPVHPSTLVSDLGTPWLRMCHRAELAAAAQTSQWLGAGPLPGRGLDALAGPRSPSAAAGFFAAMQAGSGLTAVGSGSAVVRQAGAARAQATGPKGCSARLSETVKGVAALADWGPAVMFGPAASLDKVKLCSRVQDSEWCSSVDVASLKTAAGGTACISVDQEKPSSHRDASPRTRYDIGLQVGPGEGDFRRTLVLTLLPRYVLINALPRTLEFTQASCGGRWRGVLPPGARQAFHWPFARGRRALNVRFLSDTNDDDEWVWSGDLKLDTVGEVAEYIARVKLALVGASVTAVFERQDLRWPPYRVDNLTSLGIRYRQALSSSDAAKVPAAAGDTGGSEGARGRRKGELPWDALGPQAAAPFSWDQPAGESRVLTVGFEQAGRWEEREYRLDELEKHRRVSLTRTLPSLENPRLQGEMLQRQTGTLADVWRRRYVVLKGPVLFLFKDESCVKLRGAIYLGATRSTSGRGAAVGERSSGPQRAQIGQKAGSRDKGDILDKMGNIMDDAVGLLVGPEFVTATFPGSEKFSTDGQKSAEEGTSLRADEALAVGGMMWKHMSRATEQPPGSWGLDGSSRRASMSMSQSLHPAGGGGTASGPWRGRGEI